MVTSSTDRQQRQPTTIASAPGKVLVTGGYLVLDQQYTGLVIGTSARFYTVIRTLGGDEAQGTIKVRSPQFNQATWEYTASVSQENTLLFAPK
jgi:phosphomevalonate kinase